MKILMVNKFLFPNGGSETYMFKLGDYLKSLGHEVQYFGMEHEGNCVGNNLGCYTSEMDFHNASAISKIQMSLKTIKSKEAMKKIGMVLDDFKPDVVHLNNINFQLTPAIIFEIKKRNIPVVQTVHDPQIACPNHRMYIDHRQEICSKCFNGDYKNCIKNKCIHNSLLNSTLATIESYYYHSKDTYNQVDKYICPSGFIKNVIIQGGVKEDKAVVMHNFSQNEEVSSDTSAQNNNEKYALYFGRLSVEKGIGTLVDVCEQLSDVNFVFAGTGPLFDYIKSRNLPNVKLVGFKSGKELNDLIKNAQFTLCTSEWNENCPMTIIESLSLATPVITSNLGGCPELIKNNKTGIICTAGNKEEIKQAIEKLYYSDNLSAMRQDCLKASKENDIRVYAKKLVEIYLELAEEKKNG